MYQPQMAFGSGSMNVRPVPLSCLAPILYSNFGLRPLRTENCPFHPNGHVGDELELGALSLNFASRGSFDLLA